MGSVQEWREVENTNCIASMMKLAVYRNDEVIAGRQRVHLISGPPGVGKTRLSIIADAAAKRAGKPALWAKPHSANDLEKSFIECRGRRPMIIDEGDIVFSTPQLCQVMKLALDKDGTRSIVRNLPRDRKGNETGTVTISLDVPIIVSTNMQLDDMKSVPANVRPHLQAVLDRSPPTIIPAGTAYDRWQYVVHLALTTSLLDTMETAKGREAISLSARHAALDWFTDNLSRLKSVSTRSLVGAARFHYLHERGFIPSDHKELELLSLLQPGAKRGDSPERDDWTALRKALC